MREYIRECADKVAVMPPCRVCSARIFDYNIIDGGTTVIYYCLSCNTIVAEEPVPKHVIERHRNQPPVVINLNDPLP